MKTLLQGQSQYNGKQFTSLLRNNNNNDDIHLQLPLIYNELVCGFHRQHDEQIQKSLILHHNIYIGAHCITSNTIDLVIVALLLYDQLHLF